MRILGSIFLLVSLCISLSAQEVHTPPPAAPSGGSDVRLIKYEKTDTSTVRMSKRPAFISGVSVSGDLLGLLLSGLGSYGQIEGALRVGIRQKYYPTIELGLGISDHINENTETHFKTRSPYFRIGGDYNFARDKSSGNRVFGGIRYAFTSFSFDLTGKDIIDPVWRNSNIAYDFRDMKSTVHWLEMVFGLEAKIWGNLHVGWTLRYRKRLSQSVSEVGQAWYVPGYGKNDGHVWGGTFNLVFDI